MSIIWFLLSLLFAAVIYLRLSKRIANLNLELSEGLKGEIISLITEFNHSAERNITLIEERTDLAKNISKEIAEQLSYMKKLKEALEKEIKESELKLKNILNNEKAQLPSFPIKGKQSVVAKTYEALKKTAKVKLPESQKSEEKIVKKQQNTPENRDQVEEKTESKDLVEEDGNSLRMQEGQESMEAKDSATVAENYVESKGLSIKEQVFALKKDGASLAEIIQKTNLTRGEVELILKFY